MVWSIWFGWFGLVNLIGLVEHSLVLINLVLIEFGLVWLRLVWLGMVWLCLICFGLISPACSGWVLFDLIWFGSLCVFRSVLVWFGWFWISFEIQLSTVWLSLVWCGSLVLGWVSFGQFGLVNVALVWSICFKFEVSKVRLNLVSLSVVWIGCC